jgi:hypothetical protein
MFFGESAAMQRTFCSAAHVSLGRDREYIAITEHER